MSLIEIENLSVTFRAKGREVHAVQNVSLTVAKAKAMAGRRKRFGKVHHPARHLRFGSCHRGAIRIGDRPCPRHKRPLTARGAGGRRSR